MVGGLKVRGLGKGAGCRVNLVFRVQGLGSRVFERSIQNSCIETTKNWGKCSPGKNPVKSVRFCRVRRSLIGSAPGPQPGSAARPANAPPARSEGHSRQPSRSDTPDLAGFAQYQWPQQSTAGTGRPAVEEAPSIAARTASTSQATPLLEVRRGLARRAGSCEPSLNLAHVDG